jgi:subtilisin family serine protease
MLKESRPEMESALSALTATSKPSTASISALATSHQLRLSGDRVQVLITTTPERADAAAQAVIAAGGEVTGRANGDTWLQVWAPISELDTIASDPSVDHVGRPDTALTMAITEGSAVINAPAWHAMGYTGAGVRVAIIDAGFQGYPGLLGSELPSAVTVKNFVDGENDSQVNGSTVHGTACAEIVNDIAPNASLYLAKVATAVDLEEAVNWAIAQNVKIISTSLGWYNMTPGDGTGYFANLVQSARNAGILWVTAAGNDREAHWGGTFVADQYDNHQFAVDQNVNFFGPGNGNAYLIPANYPIRVFLRWDDWAAVNQDYDLYLLRWNDTTKEWEEYASSQDLQNGGPGQTPTEYVGVLSSGSSTAYGFLIARHSASRDVNLEIFAPKVARLDKFVTQRSLANLADAPAAMTVAALDINSPYPQESYSSEGPTNGAGGTAGGGLLKPDIAAYANVSTASYTNPKFNGTSSATPHVAAAAALIKGLYPGFPPSETQSFLQRRAVDMGAAGKDALYGWGRLSLGTPPAAPVFSKKRYVPLVIR